MSNKSVSRLSIILATTLVSGCEKPAEPLTPANVEAIFPASVSAVAGTAVATAPGVKVTTAKGTAVPGVAVAFAVTSGGGSISSASATTAASGIATLAFWNLGTVAGTNVLTSTVVGLPAVTFTATGVAGTAAILAVGTAPSATAVNRVVLAMQPVVRVQDANGNPVTTSTASVTASVTSGGGSLLGTATVNAIAGVVTFTNLAVAGTAGSKTISFSSTGLTSAQAGVTTTAAAAGVIAISAGDNQSGTPSGAVAVPPAVIVTDMDANPVSGIGVAFAVTGGGGGITGANPTSNAAGLATAGTWTLGSAAGANTLSATAVGLSGSPLTFTATATTNSIATVSPATLTSGATATITGTGFSATPASNVVTIDGVTATVTAASPTILTVTVPTLPCTAGHNAVVSVNPNGSGAVTKNHPVVAATQLSLPVGQSAILSTAAAARCNELSNTGGTYYIAVYNSNSVYDTTGARFELLGSAGASAPPVSPDMTSAARMLAPPSGGERQTMSATDRAHVQFLERDLAFLRQNGRNWRQGAAPRGAAAITPVSGIAHAVGDLMSVKLPDARTNTCTTSIPISGRVAFVGTKSIIVEDNANPLAGTLDTTYAQIGNEFDAVMWPILETNFGNPIVNDAVLDNNGRIVMVFSDKLNPVPGTGGSGPGHELGALGIAGFVTGADFFPVGTCAASNRGEYFYATSPTTSGTINTSGSPPDWRWRMRGTIIHEVKHIVSTGERFSRNGGSTFETSWLEETNARMSEELYERARYGFAQKSNIVYGSAGNPVGPYCGVRACSGQPRGIIRVFTELASSWYSGPHDYSPLGRINSSDFSFYATGWSLVRWILDNSATAEATVLKNMTQEPTLTGLSNLETKSGLTFANVQPKWFLSMLVDDHPSLTPSDATLKQPSWNFRNVFAGYKADFSVSWSAWPFIPTTAAFGAFSTTLRVRPGTSAAIQLSGSQLTSQLLELKASGAAAAAPTELRMAIIRVQ